MCVQNIHKIYGMCGGMEIRIYAFYYHFPHSAFELDGPGIESRWVEIFRTCPDRPWGPPSLLYNGYRVFPGGQRAAGAWHWPLTPFSCRGHVGYSYTSSPNGPYGLFSTSVPVQGCNFLLYHSALFNRISQWILHLKVWEILNELVGKN